MQTVIPVEDVASGAGSAAGQPASWQDYYGSSTPSAPITDWSSNPIGYESSHTDITPILLAGGGGLLLILLLTGRRR